MSALTEKIAAEHALTYDEQRVRHVCTCRGWLDDDGDQTHLAHVVDVTEAAVREHIATELEAQAESWSTAAACHRDDSHAAHDQRVKDTHMSAAHACRNKAVATFDAAHMARTPTKEK